MIAIGETTWKGKGEAKEEGRRMKRSQSASRCVCPHSALPQSVPAAQSAPNTTQHKSALTPQSVRTTFPSPQSDPVECVNV